MLNRLFRDVDCRLLSKMGSERAGKGIAADEPRFHAVVSGGHLMQQPVSAPAWRACSARPR
ncbi:hypothetical protein SPHINGO8AM_70130 [Sphingomonas sp. 8AM]|nr:hypothetical protein SPHINGO8AM_70130 [Sphingomonas sp. 8AM]